MSVGSVPIGFQFTIALGDSLPWPEWAADSKAVSSCKAAGRASMWNVRCLVIGSAPSLIVRVPRLPPTVQPAARLMIVRACRLWRLRLFERSKVVSRACGSHSLSNANGCRRASISLMTWVSWILTPGRHTETSMIGKAMRSSGGKSTCTLSHWA